MDLQEADIGTIEAWMYRIDVQDRNEDESIVYSVTDLRFFSSDPLTL